MTDAPITTTVPIDDLLEAVSLRQAANRLAAAKRQKAKGKGGGRKASVTHRET